MTEALVIFDLAKMRFPSEYECLFQQNCLHYSLDWLTNWLNEMAGSSKFAN